uniref:hypothetical protein n=1 Tax=Endozoicomonas euniceicola TaxID=1234143 RepID=UPI00384F15E8
MKCYKEALNNHYLIGDAALMNSYEHGESNRSALRSTPSLRNATMDYLQKQVRYRVDNSEVLPGSVSTGFST